MKRLLVLTLILLATPLFAQEETLLGADGIESGGYGAVVTKFTTVNGKFGLLVGARGGWIINHTFSIGLAGYGLVNNVNAHTVGPYGEPYLMLGYGGLDLEYVHRSNDLVHFSIHALVGGGAAGFRYGIGSMHDGYMDNEPMYHYPPWSSYWNPQWSSEWDGYGGHHAYKAFFIFEPGANIDVNITTWMRTSIGGSYRFVSGLSSAATTNRDLRGPSAMLTFRFGSF